MKNLMQLQEDFQNYLLHSDQNIVPSIQNTAKLTSEQRLAVYANAYSTRLIEALETNFPALKSCLGEAAFYELSTNYLHTHPSTYKSIRWFGDHLAEFLQKVHKDKPYLAELALFEWTMSLAFDAKDESIISIADIQTVPAEAWDTLCFTLHPSAHLLNLQWDIANQWKNMMEGNELEEWGKETSPYGFIVWRKHLNIHFCSLSEAETWAIQTVNAGNTFTELCEGLTQWFDDEAGMNAASYLKGWTEAGLLTSIKY